MDVFSLEMSLALTSGMVAAFNPCGVILLPSYIAFLISQSNNEATITNLIKFGIKIGVQMTLGFMTVFLISGLAFSALGSVIFEVAPWLTVAIGVVLTVMGVILFIKPEQFQSISKFTSRLGSEIKEKNNLNFYLYGIGYAIVSLGCTLAVFMVVVVSVFKSGDIGKGIFNFFLYGLGMGIVVTLITIFSLLAKEVVQNWLRKIVPYINKIAAILVFITGIYLIIYWI